MRYYFHLLFFIVFSLLIGSLMITVDCKTEVEVRTQNLRVGVIICIGKLVHINIKRLGSAK